MRAFILAVTGLAITVAACSSYGTSVVEVNQPSHVASVSVAFPASLAAGQSARGVATLKDQNGAILANRLVSWYTSSASIASVNDSGVIAAVAPGAAIVSAVSEGISGQKTMTVVPPTPTPVATLSIALSPSAVLVGQTAHATAVPEDSMGNPLSGRTVTWQSTNSSVAVVSPTGDVSAVAPGTTAIMAASEGKTASAALSVTAPAPVPVATVTVSPATSSLQVGVSAQLSAVTRDANNNVLTGRVVAWSSANAGIASVNSNGLVSAVSAGTTQVMATSEGKSSSATITVTAPSGGAVWRGNEPGGLALVSDQPFNSIASNSWRDEAGTIISDASAPQSPNNVFEISFPSGYGGGSAPGGADMDLNLSALYFSIYVKYSSNWEGHPPEGINKLVHLWINGGNLCVISAEGQGSDPLYPAITFQSIIGGGNQGGGAFGQYKSPTPISRGQWHLLEVLANKNTSGQANGSVYLYVDGVLVAQATGIQLTSAGNNWNMLQISPIWGGTGGTVTNTQSLRVDHIYVSGN